MTSVQVRATRTDDPPICEKCEVGLHESGSRGIEVADTGIDGVLFYVCGACGWATPAIRKAVGTPTKWVRAARIEADRRNREVTEDRAEEAARIARERLEASRRRLGTVVAQVDEVDAFAGFKLTRGDVLWVDLDTGQIGTETRKVRPCIVVSRDRTSLGLDGHGAIVVPVKDAAGRQYEWQVEIPPNTLGPGMKGGVALCDSPRYVDAARFASPVIAHLPAEIRRRIDLALRFTLGL